MYYIIIYYNRYILKYKKMCVQKYKTNCYFSSFYHVLSKFKFQIYIKQYYDKQF